MKPKIVAIIQARMASTRLPGKVLLPLGPDNKSVLWWMSKRASLAELVDEVVIATTKNNSNDPIRDAFPFHVFSWSGNEDDVIGRVLWTAKKTDADIIVDLTSDCPMVDPRHIDYLINILINNEEGGDYISNCIYRNWPDGLDIQVYWTGVLKRCQKLFNPSQHCGWNIAQHGEVFDRCHWQAPDKYNCPKLGLTLDTPKDYELLKRIFNKFGHDPGFKVEDVIDFLIENPGWITNKNVKRKTPEEG